MIVPFSSCMRTLYLCKLSLHQTWPYQNLGSKSPAVKCHEWQQLSYIILHLVTSPFNAPPSSWVDGAMLERSLRSNSYADRNKGIIKEMCIYCVGYRSCYQLNIKPTFNGSATNLRSLSSRINVPKGDNENSDVKKLWIVTYGPRSSRR